jgi:hypothetical protein
MPLCVALTIVQEDNTSVMHKQRQGHNSKGVKALAVAQRPCWDTGAEVSSTCSSTDTIVGRTASFIPQNCSVRGSDVYNETRGH